MPDPQSTGVVSRDRRHQASLAVALQAFAPVIPGGPFLRHQRLSLMAWLFPPVDSDVASVFRRPLSV